MYRPRFPGRKEQTNEALEAVVREVIPAGEGLVGVVLDTHRWRSCAALGRTRAGGAPPRLVVPNPSSEEVIWEKNKPMGATAVACDLGTFLRTDRGLAGACNVAYFDYCGLYDEEVKNDIRQYFRSHARPAAQGVFAVTCSTRESGQTQDRMVRCLTRLVSDAARRGPGLRCKIRARNLYQHVSLVFELRPLPDADHAPRVLGTSVRPKGAWMRAPIRTGLPEDWWVRRKTCRTGNHTYADPGFDRTFRSLAEASRAIRANVSTPGM